MEIAQVIDRLGGTRVVSVLCGVSLSTVSMWKARDSIPNGYWKMLVVGAAERNISLDYEQLAQLHAKVPPKPNPDKVSDTAQAN